MADQSLIIDYNKKNACKLILPSPPVLASEPTKNFQFHRYELSPHHAPAHTPVQHVIVTYSGSQPFSLKRELGGTTKDEYVKTDDIMVSPAHIEHSADWDLPVELNFLLFDPKQIAQAAYEFIDPDLVEVLPHRTIPDPLIAQVSKNLLARIDDQAYIDAAGFFLSEHILKYYCSRRHQLKQINHPLSPIELKKIIDYVETNIGKKTIISELANLVGMSHCHFGRAFKQSIGTTPLQYLITRRVEAATYLLAQTDLDIKTIAEMSGFPSQSNFSATFHRFTKTRPTDYRKNL
jgi:AraC family transcriptional regulator